MRLVFTPTVLGLCAGLALVATSRLSPAYAARDICVKILQPVKSTTRLSAGGPMPKVFRFRLVYPPRDPGQSPASVTAQPLPIPYVIRATAQVADDTPANNQAVTTFRFPPGGTASCLPWRQ